MDGAALPGHRERGRGHRLRQPGAAAAGGDRHRCRRPVALARRRPRSRGERRAAPDGWQPDRVLRHHGHAEIGAELLRDAARRHRRRELLGRPAPAADPQSLPCPLELSGPASGRPHRQCDRPGRPVGQRVPARRDVLRPDHPDGGLPGGGARRLLAPRDRRHGDRRGDGVGTAFPGADRAQGWLAADPAHPRAGDPAGRFAQQHQAPAGDGQGNRVRAVPGAQDRLGAQGHPTRGDRPAGAQERQRAVGRDLPGRRLLRGDRDLAGADRRAGRGGRPAQAHQQRHRQDPAAVPAGGGDREPLSRGLGLHRRYRAMRRSAISAVARRPWSEAAGSSR